MDVKNTAIFGMARDDTKAREQVNNIIEKFQGVKESKGISKRVNLSYQTVLKIMLVFC